MHWRTQFPPKHASALAEVIAVFRTSFHPETVMASELPDELPPAPATALEMPIITANPAPAAR
jgi:hypothetical protein